MKKWLKVLIVVLAVVLVLASAACTVVFWYYVPYTQSSAVFDIAEADVSDGVMVMTFNIRCYMPTDFFKKSWFYRADLVIDTIASTQPDVIAFQEVTPMHEAFLREHLKGYGFVCAYRSRKGTQEGLMIAYSLASFEPVRDGYFWISDTPERESKDWGTAFPRIALYVTLQNKQSGRQCTIMDVHLDHVSEEARQEGMRVLLEQKQALGIESMVLLGDMNDHDDTLMYTQAVSGGLVDAKEVASSVYEGSGATYHKYGKKLNAKRIDYFFLTPDLDVLSYAVIDRTVDGVYPSDHFPLVIRLAPTAW